MPGTCEGPVALGTPVPVVDQASLSETSFTVTWEAVENAVSYAYTLNNGTEETAGSTTVTFSDLTASTQYTFKVKAVAAEDGGYTDSEWASLTVTTLGIPTVAEITLDTAAIDLKIGETYLLTAEISPAEAADASITWSSSNPETASVDGDGLVTAVALGETVITATAGDKSATCTVNVMEDMTADEVRAAIQDAIADGIVNIKLIGEFEKIGIPTDASVYNPNYDQNPFYNTAIELIDMTEVTGWPEVDVDGQLSRSERGETPRRSKSHRCAGILAVLCP